MNTLAVVGLLAWGQADDLTVMEPTVEQAEAKKKLSHDHMNHEHHHSHSHSIAPIGVMGDHVHAKGEWMFSYRYMTMQMEQNQNGTDRVSDLSITGTGAAPGAFLVAPQNMEMEMHMWGAMYGVTDDLTLGVMFPYVIKTMEHRRRVGDTFAVDTEGLGDIKLTALYRVWQDNKQGVHLNLGLSVPSGSLTEQRGIPNIGMAGDSARRVPYPMQIGSGTVDLYPGVTYTGHSGDFFWGAQVSGVIRAGENDEGYSMGDEFHGTIWGTYRWTDWLAQSIRLAGQVRTNYDGADPAILQPRGLAATAIVPTADPSRRGGERLDLSMGVNIEVPLKFLKGNEFSVELGLPVYESVNGPQLTTDWFMTAGWEVTF